MLSPGRARQQEVFVGGMSGQRPVVPVAPDALAEAARKAMTPQAWAYVAGGAGAETTMAANRRALDRWEIVPRVLNNVEQRDLSVDLLEMTLASPLLLAPIGVLEMAHPEADLAVARAAAREQVPFIFSSQASVPMETTAKAMGDVPFLFQLYWSTQDDLVRSFVQRAERCGCRAIVLTLDTTLLGWRPRDLDLAYLPFLRGKGIAQYTSDPVFNRLLDEVEDADADTSRRVNLHSLKALAELVRSHPGGALGNLRSGRALKAVRLFIQIYSRPSLTWDDLSFLREQTRLPLLLKGILHPDDARLAVLHGVDGLIVTNHGGRQVDGAIGALDALPGVVEAVGGTVPVLFDSGGRGGADVFKALALGARAVCLGRPYVYGLAVAGQRGVEEVLRNVKAEFDLTMGLSGCRSVREITRECLNETPR